MESCFELFPGPPLHCIYFLCIFPFFSASGYITRLFMPVGILLSVLSWPGSLSTLPLTPPSPFLVPDGSALVPGCIEGTESRC